MAYARKYSLDKNLGLIGVKDAKPLERAAISVLCLFVGVLVL